MRDFQASVVLPRQREATFNHLRNPLNFLKLFPTSVTKHVDAKLPELMIPGSCLEFNFKAMGNHFQIILQITDLVDCERIVATQLKGPFKQWIHEQQFSDAEPGSTLLTNSVRFEPPGGLLGILVTRKQVLTHLDEWVGRGHELLRQSMIKDAHSPE